MLPMKFAVCMLGCLDFARAYFHEINGNCEPGKVAEDIRKLLPK